MSDSTNDRTGQPLLERAYANPRPFDPVPARFIGEVNESEDQWVFKVSHYYSPLKAKTSPTDAASRIRCLESLATGLSHFCDRLSKQYTSDNRTLKDSDMTGLDAPIIDWIRAEETRLREFQDSRKQYEDFALEIKNVLNNLENSTHDQFLNACIRVNLLTVSLTFGKWIHDISSMLLWLAGREDASIDAEIERQVWSQLLDYKVNCFTKNHRWLKLRLNPTASRNMPSEPKDALVIDRLETFLKMSKKDWLKVIDPVQRIGDDQEIPLNPNIDPNPFQRAYSMIQWAFGVRKKHKHLTAPAPGSEFETRTGIECSICTMDLYERLPDHFFDIVAQPPNPNPPSQTPAPANIGGLHGLLPNFFRAAIDQAGDFAQTVAINLWNSNPTATATNLPPATNPTRHTSVDGDNCNPDPEWWKIASRAVFIPPRPIFCPSCRKGFHVECLWEWLKGRRLDGHNGRNCPFCRTSMDQGYVKDVVRPALKAELLRKRQERRRYIRAERKAQREN